MIIVIGGIKGGSGKTTIATNLTVLRSMEGKKVLLVDGDEQKSASKWSNHREAKGLETKWKTVTFAGKSIYTQVSRMKSDYDDVIIDVGGRETNSLRAAIAIADLFVIPFKPRSLDIWTLDDVNHVFSEMLPANPKLQCLTFINQADSRGSDNEDAISILKEKPYLHCLDITIGLRKAFANAASEGIGVFEMKNRDRKAMNEIFDLYNFLYNKCTVCIY